jgi:hypothetical protein
MAEGRTRERSGWEFFENGERCGLRVPLAPRDAWVGVARA